MLLLVVCIVMVFLVYSFIAYMFPAWLPSVPNLPVERRRRLREARTLRMLVFSAAVFPALAQAPWPQPDGGASHSRAMPVVWPRNATVLTQLNTVPLCSPILIGNNGTLYAAGSDGLLHAFTPTGRLLWVVPIGYYSCSRQLALNDEGSFLFSYLPSLNPPYTNSTSETSILVIALSSASPPLVSLIAVNGLVLEAVVSGGGDVVVLAGLSTDASGELDGCMLYSYNVLGQLKWSSNVSSVGVPPFYSCQGIFAVRDNSVFAYLVVEELRLSHTVMQVLGLSTGEVIWQHMTPPTVISALSAPNAATLICLWRGGGAHDLRHKRIHRDHYVVFRYSMYWYRICCILCW